jgi:hypothetical protein
VSSSASGSDASRGLSWHRVGIDGNFPKLPDIRAGRIQRGGGMHYSSQRGKVCPGGGKIQQIPGIMDAILGQPGTTPPIPTTPEPPNDGITIDGLWGRQTTTAAQLVVGTVADGEVWGQYKPNAQPAFVGGWVYNYPNPKGSPLIRAMQAIGGVPPAEQDGVVGEQFIRIFQQRMGTHVDGELWAPSPAVAEFQRRLNTGDFAFTHGG